MVDQVTSEPVVAPVVTPVAPIVDNSSTVQAPVVAPAVEAAPVVTETKIEAPKTVLGEALTDKPVEVQPTTETKTPVEGQSAEPAPPPKVEEVPFVAPTYDKFNVPEGFTLANEQVTKLTSLLTELEKDGKADHAIVQAFGQKAVDFHVSEIKNAVDNLNKAYTTAWEKQKTDWKNQFLADPAIGGNQFQTTIDSALSFIRTHGGTPEQQAEFRNLMETSGLGNHPAMIRLLASAGKAMSEGRPLAATKPVSEPKSKIATMYGKQK